MLLVPDSLFWATGTICREIVVHHPWIRATVCSTRVLKKLLERDESFLTRIDLAHFVDPRIPADVFEKLSRRMPCVGSIHHVEPGVAAANAAADLVIAGSRETHDRLVSSGEVAAERAAILPYGVDTSVFVPARKHRRRRCRSRLGIHRKAFVIGFFSKRTSDSGDRKGVGVFTAGLDRLRTRLPHLAVLIVGPGWASLVEDLRGAGVDCFWVPFVPDYGRVVDAYHALDVYWVTSKLEGGPLTLLEAMSCGISCVTTPVGLAPEVAVDAVNACVVPIGSVDGLVEKTEALARDEALRTRLGENARATVGESRDWGTTLRALEHCYSRALGRFGDRTGRRAEVGRRAAPPRRPSVAGSDVPLHAIAPSLRRWVRMMEVLYWIEYAGFGESPAVARRLSWRACLANPRSPEPWGYVLRSHFPGVYRHLSRLGRGKGVP